uniref:probable serine/threonine-protein kinase CST isoform X2 n=2 Tax=Erigeron canadensis TaxID=72917 RepID=UPI001CB98364|nr:probable serine/threonine-protein kinase CST isoform X2 [Erigeron canadensis]
MESEPSTSTAQWLQPCRKFQLREILLATENFNESLVIGKGGFGKVYKGEVIVGTSHVVAAIKRLDLMSDQGAAEFWAEVEMLSKLRHSHLVSLIGYCNYETEMILVYEYMPNGTLEDHLHKLRSGLSWIDRLKICIGAARGLDYLHTGTGIEFGVIHRDVKSSNILLNESRAAKISDFGLSKVGPTNQPRTYVNTLVKGTFGYLDPNYFATGKLTRKSDVYAFGVVLFEVLCQKRPVDRSLEYGLAAWAQDSIKEGSLKNIVNPDIRGEISPKCLKEFARIAEKCLNNHPKDRPTMTEIIFSLESLLILQLQTPGKSIFTRMVDVFSFNSTVENPGMGFGLLAANKRKHPLLRKNFVQQNVALVLEDHLQGTNTHIGGDQGNSIPTSKNEEPTSIQVLEEPASSDSEATDDDPLPAVEALQISGEAFPGRELQATGYSINGTTSCHFEWVRHMEDGSVIYIEGAKQPNYLVNADDVNTYLAIEIQPMDDRLRKGELVTAFANGNRKIVCDPEMHDHIEKAVQAGHAEHRLSLWAEYLNIWEPVTLVVKKDGINIKGSDTTVNEKFSATTRVLVSYGNAVEFSVVSSVERQFRVEQGLAAISSRDIIVLTMRYFIRRAVQQKEVKKKGLFFK